MRNITHNPGALVIWAISMLMVANIVLNITEPNSISWKIANITLPAGFFLLFMAASKMAGLMTVLSLPFMFLAAFQLVLSYLYGEAIIAVDMFLNVVTTNAAEVSELLGNLFIAIISVILLYIPPLVWGITAICRHQYTSVSFRKKSAVAGIALLIIGGIASTIATARDEGEFHREIFPINVICNLHEAFERAKDMSHYEETCAGFTYNAKSSRPADEREIYIFVIGETARGHNWQLGGYNRPTNPMLSKEPDAVFCPRAISESNTTHKSVPMLMSFIDSENFDSINNYKSILTAMKEAGFRTHFFSNQAPNRSYTEYFGKEADNVQYADFSQTAHPYDTSLLTMVEKAIADTINRKHFIVLHTYGSHFLYRDRYPRNFAKFTPDNAIDANAGNRSELINAYDNTILFTDAFLDNAIEMLKKADCRSALLYSADHGEDIFDDERLRFLHASPNPTYWQLHVGMLVWLSKPLIESSPEFMPLLRRNAKECVSPQKSMFNTVIELAAISTPRFKPSQSLVNESYHYGKPVYLTDLNVAVPLGKAGLRSFDKENMSKVLKCHKDSI